jgi:exopolysaccharide production protein ExoQ
MPPQLALLLTLAFIAALFVRDHRERPAITGALWIPLLWLLIIGSRNVSEWIGFGGATNIADGSPLDSTIYLTLELAALYVLFRRRVSLMNVLSRNPWFAAFFILAAVSVLWSDFPFVAAKRWSKALSHPLMLLVVATEPDPREAFVRLMKRTAYVLLPLSILLIRYYPDLGRVFDPWSGMPANNGVATSKNGLGWDCLLLGFFFSWHALTVLRSRKAPNRRRELYLSGAFLVLIGWLLRLSQSATAFTVLVVGVSIVLLLDWRWISDKSIRVYLIPGLVLLSCLYLFGITDMLIAALGRDPTLTGRTELWDHVLSFNINPIVGVGFESFWLGARQERMNAIYWWQPNQAHNGYLETYLNLGWIGVILLIGWILSGFRHALRLLRTDFEFGRFAFAFLVMAVMYNFTEAAFKGLHVIWFGFYVAAMDYHRADLSAKTQHSLSSSTTAPSAYPRWAYRR